MVLVWLSSQANDANNGELYKYYSLGISNNHKALEVLEKAAKLNFELRNKTLCQLIEQAIKNIRYLNLFKYYF